MTILHPDCLAVSKTAHKSKITSCVAVLGLSLLLHSGVVFLVIIAGGFNSNVRSPGSLVVQDISLSSSIHAPINNVSDSLAPVMESPSASTENIESTEKISATEANTDDSSSNGNVASPMSTPLGLGMTHGYFSSLADGKTLKDDIREYYFEMVAKINRGWWNNAGYLKDPLRRDGVFELLIKRDGSIDAVRILQSNGSQEIDRLMIEIIRSTSPLPPLPSSYNLEIFRAPVKIKAPSPLFR